MPKPLLQINRVQNPTVISGDAKRASGSGSECAVELLGVGRRFGQAVAVNEVSLTIAKGEFFSLLGPSGCGKTTLLRIIAGLEFPDSGSLRIAGMEAAGIPAHRRPVNTVFQSYALFPHLTVRENVAFGLRMKGVPKPGLHRRVGAMMDLVEISALAGRKPGQLSGGEKQRVALARALVNEPEVLLLDEPLGALDLKLRKQLQAELRRLQRRLGTTFVHVTHDQDEALAMSDRIAVMRAGSILQVDTPAALYERPRTAFVAEFLGACNVITIEVTGRDEQCCIGTAPFGRVRFALSAGEESPAARTRVQLAIRPEKVRLRAGGQGSTPNTFQGTVLEMVYSGSETRVTCEVQGFKLTSVLMLASQTSDPFQVGQRIECALDPTEFVLLQND